MKDPPFRCLRAGRNSGQFSFKFVYQKNQNENKRASTQMLPYFGIRISEFWPSDFRIFDIRMSVFWNSQIRILKIRNSERYFRKFKKSEIRD